MDKDFQERVQDWVLTCFGEEVALDRTERNRRFLEEALELVQSLGASKAFAHDLVDYVFARPEGDPAQEVGGVMVTLASLCATQGIDMAEAGESELSRIEQPEVIAKIRTKHAEKPEF